METKTLRPSTIISSVKKFVRRHVLWIGLLILVILLAGSFLLGRTMVYRAHPELVQSDEANAMLAKVGKLIVLPVGETPSMASITDAAAVRRSQPLLAQAENGDVLILYKQAGQAILYRPSTNKLIVVGPVDTTEPAQTKTAPVEEEPIVTEPISTSTSDHATSTKKN